MINHFSLNSLALSLNNVSQFLFIITTKDKTCFRLNSFNFSLMNSLLSQLEKIASYFPKYKNTNEEVSKVPVAWHLDHCLRVINSISRALEQSDPEKFDWNFNFWRIVFFSTKHIPRGRGKSPAQVKPNEDITLEELTKHLAFARENIKTLNSLPKKANFPHPYFGQLNLSQSIKFIRIHTKHHLKIIEDILK